MATSGIDCDDDLFTSLISATPEEVDILVDIITDFSRGRAGLDADIKKQLVQAKHSSRPAGYTKQQLDLLGHELQQFGGHSAMNLARRLLKKSAVPYAEIVNDVYQKLNGSGATSVADKERQIALALFGAGWRELPASERFERATSTKVLTGLFKLEEALPKGAASVIGLSASRSAALFTMAATTGLRLNPFGAAFTAGVGLHSSVAEAYRVTVPFVAQMGWIRLRRETPAMPPATGPDTQPVATTDQTTADLMIQDDQGGTLLKLNVVQRPPAGTHRPLPTDQISALNPLLANVPGLAAMGELASGNYVMCSLPFETLTKNANGDGSVRAFVRTGGKISEQASLSLPEDLQNVLLSGAVWNAVSSAVGQKHLHDINEKLNAIKRQLDAVQHDLDEKQWEKLTGMFEYTQGVLDHYPQEGIDSTARQTLENHHSQITSLAQYFARKMNEELKRAQAVQADKLFGVDSTRQALQDSLTKMEGWVSGYLQTAQLQVVSSALRYLAEPLQRYRAQAAKALESLGQLEEIGNQSRSIYNSQMELTSSRMFSLDASLKQGFTAQLDALTSALTQGPRDTQQLQQSLFDQGERQVLLRYENGQIAEAQLLERAV
ncbi:MULTISPECIES: hypothetical protein [unclassified Pseudomonas]|uniref:hypothetical protein n=1 Tax=unclassified Pseudomonas TaxID=196821 RepID=UPI0020980C9E|nr:MULTISPECIES: hypothetical protein [unclassified Pseudomonas]MCO7518404.1 hypothetical protein [Pseudomonas sp. 1]MCO7538852.1 hypothetical protein [Pseudomonas sp. VA159-2]